MAEYDSAMQLHGPPGEWLITLKSGESIHLLAHGYSVEGGEYRFDFLVKADPLRTRR